MNAKKLRSQCIANPEKSVLVTCFNGEQLVGHAFATVWDFEGGLYITTLFFYGAFMFSPGVVGWITQLVFDATARKCYIATQLLQTLKLHPLFCNVTTVGLVSSHPAACYALAKYACKLFYLLISSRR